MKCKKCEIEKNEEEFNKWYKKTGTWGFRKICKNCDHLENKKYRELKKEELKILRRKRLGPYKQKLTQKQIKERNIRYSTLNRKNNRIKWIAREYLRYMVKTSKIIKPDICEMCLCNKKLEGHHKDYSKPLDVKWVCKQCHTDIHRTSK